MCIYELNTTKANQYNFLYLATKQEDEKIWIMRQEIFDLLYLVKKE